MSKAQDMFNKDLNLNITVEGKRHIDTALGSGAFKEAYFEEKVQTWCSELSFLCKIAHKHSAYAGYIQLYMASSTNVPIS